SLGQRCAVSLTNSTTVSGDRLQEAIVRLNRVWETISAPEGTVDLSAFLVSEELPLQGPHLCELVKADMTSRACRNRAFDVERYLPLLPGLADDALLLVVLHEEYRLKCLFGSPPPLDDYQRRFPRHFEVLLAMVAPPPSTLPTERLAPPDAS